MVDKVYVTQTELPEVLVPIRCTYVFLKKIAVAVLTWVKVGEVIVNGVLNMEKVNFFIHISVS